MQTTASKTFCEVVYTRFRDVVVRMSNVQKVQAALIPDGVDPSDYEYMLSNVTTNGPIFSSGTLNTWVQVPTLGSIYAEQQLFTFKIDRQDDEVGSITCWVQFTLSVRLKSNHADMVSGVIKVMPTLVITEMPTPTWGQVPNVIWSGYGVSSVERYLEFLPGGTWWSKSSLPPGNSTAFDRNGTWLVAGESANYSIRATGITTQNKGAVTSTITGAWSKLNSAHKIFVKTIVQNYSGQSAESFWKGTIEIRDDITGKIISRSYVSFRMVANTA